MKNLNEKLKACKSLVINGETYFGSAIVERETDTIKIFEAVEVTEKNNFKKVIKEWIKANNSNRLESFEVTGLSTLTKKDLNKEQLMKIDTLTAVAIDTMENAMSDIFNDRIDLL